MASISIPCFLFLSLLSHSFLLSKCDVDDDLLHGINQWRGLSKLTPLNVTDGADCLADGIAGTFDNRTCTNTSTTTVLTDQRLATSFLALVNGCGLKITAAAADSCVLAACARPNLSYYFTSTFPTYLNSTNYSAIGIAANQRNWKVVVLTTNTTTTNTTSAASSPPGTSILLSLIYFIILLS